MTGSSIQRLVFTFVAVFGIGGARSVLAAANPTATLEELESVLELRDPDQSTAHVDRLLASLEPGDQEAWLPVLAELLVVPTTLFADGVDRVAAFAAVRAPAALPPLLMARFPRAARDAYGNEPIFCRTARALAGAAPDVAHALADLVIDQFTTGTAGGYETCCALDAAVVALWQSEAATAWPKVTAAVMARQDCRAGLFVKLATARPGDEALARTLAPLLDSESKEIREADPLAAFLRVGVPVPEAREPLMRSVDRFFAGREAVDFLEKYDDPETRAFVAELRRRWTVEDAAYRRERLSGAAWQTAAWLVISSAGVVQVLSWQDRDTPWRLKNGLGTTNGAVLGAALGLGVTALIAGAGPGHPPGTSSGMGGALSGVGEALGLLAVGLVLGVGGGIGGGWLSWSQRDHRSYVLTIGAVQSLWPLVPITLTWLDAL